MDFHCKILWVLPQKGQYFWHLLSDGDKATVDLLSLKRIMTIKNAHTVCTLLLRLMLKTMYCKISNLISP